MVHRSGLAPTMMGVSHVAIQFPLYEYIKVRLAARGGGRRSPETLSIGVRYHYCLSTRGWISKS